MSHLHARLSGKDSLAADDYAVALLPRRQTRRVILVTPGNLYLQSVFTSIPLVDPETLEFEVNVDGYVSSGGLGGPAILPQSLAKIAQLTAAFPDHSFSGIGGIGEFAHALNYFLLGCGTVQVCTAAMLDHAIGPNVIKGLIGGMERFLERHAEKGWGSLEDFRGLRRDRVVAHSQIRRPAAKQYYGGHETAEGYAAPAEEPGVRS